MKFQHLRSSVRDKLPAALDVGQIAVNFNDKDPFLSIKDSAGTIRRLHGATLDATAPASPDDGQLWVDLSLDPPELKVWDDTNSVWEVATAVPAASETAQGIAELATQTEVDAGTDDTRIVTPLKLATAVGTLVPAASETAAGKVELATAAETTTGTDNTRAVHPAGLKVELDKKAPLDSPALTGTPTAPTPTAGDNDTSIATTEFVTSAIAAIPSVADATETVKGIAEIATTAEVTAGTDDTRIVTPLKLRQSEVWTRTGTVISPAVAGDDVTTTGDVNAANVVATGDVQAASLNSGPLAGFRNILLNGNLAINQRGVNIAAAATGSYGQDRWKKTAGGMTQIVEAGNFEPNATYTLSGTGVTTQQLTAPATGNWTIPDVPVTARKIQLEPGPVATPFEHRPIGVELPLCQRYFQTYSRIRGYPSANDPTSNTRFYDAPRPVIMRANPTETATSSTAVTYSGSADNIRFNTGSVSSTTGLAVTNYTADAEL